MASTITLILALLACSANLNGQVVYKNTVNLGPVNGNGRYSAGIVVYEELGRAYVANTGSENISIVDMETQSVIDVIKIGYPTQLMKNHANGSLYVRCIDKIFKCDITDNSLTEIASLVFDEERIALNQMLYDQNMDRIYITAGSSMMIIDAETDILINSITLPYRISTIAIDLMNNRFLLGSDVINNIYVLDYETFIIEDTIATAGQVSKLYYDNQMEMMISFEWDRNELTHEGWSSIFTYNSGLVQTGQIQVVNEGIIEPWAHYIFYDELYNRLLLYTHRTGPLTVQMTSMTIFPEPEPPRNLKIGQGLDTSATQYYSLPSEGTSYISIISRKADPSQVVETDRIMLGYGLSDIMPIPHDNTIYTIEHGGQGWMSTMYKLDGNDQSIIDDLNISSNTEQGYLELIDDQYLILSRNHYFETMHIDSKEIVNSFSTGDVIQMYEILGLSSMPNSTNVLLTGSNWGGYENNDTKVLIVDCLTSEVQNIIDIPDDLSGLDNSGVEYIASTNSIVNVTNGHIEGGTSESNNITIIDGFSFQVDTTIYLQYSPWLWSINESSGNVYTYDMDNNKIHKYSNRLLTSVNASDYVTAVGSHPNTHNVYLLHPNPARLEVLDSNLVHLSEILIPDNPVLAFGEIFRYNKYNGDVYITGMGGAEIFVFNDDAARLIPELPAPDNAITTVGDRQLTINWDGIDESILGYNIYRNTPPEDSFIKINSIPVIDTYYTDYGLTNGSTYSYKLAAVGNWNLVGIYSAPTQAVPVDLPDFQLIPQDYSLPMQIDEPVSNKLSIIREAQFNSDISFSVPNPPDNLDFEFSPNPATIEENISLSVTADAEIELGTYYFEAWAQGGGQREIIELSIMVSNGYSLSLHADPPTPNMYEPITLFGLIDPGEQQDVACTLIDPEGERSQLSTQTDPDGNYQVQFTPEQIGSWEIFSQIPNLNNMMSDTISVEVLKASSRISCTTDLVDSAEVGWAMTIKGQVYPPPGAGTASLQVMKPDNSVELIDGVLINDQGYYGHNIPANQTGLWTINASWPGNDAYVGAESNTLTVPVGLGVGLGILVRAETDGANPDYDQSLDSLSSFAYQVLSERRYTDGMIYYLNPDQTLDLDDDGFADEVDDQPTPAALEYAITTWARETLNDSVSLSVFLVGPGTTEGFQINQTEVLSPAELNTWLTELEDSTGAHINVIFETDQGLGFTDALSNQTRTILTSTDTTNWNTYDSGQISFSRLFWNGIFSGMSVGEAFLTTKDQMVSMPELFGNQLPQIEANGTQVHNEQNDYDLASNVFMGGTYLLGDFPPDMVGGGTTEGGGGLFRYINPALPYQTTLSRAATFGIRVWTQINDENPGELNVRALISAPESNRVTIQSMSYAGDGIYEAYLTEFDGPGMYDVFVYATDQSGHMSSPIRKQLFLTEIDLDFIAPDLGIGLLQNPLFDDYFDLYVLSSEQLIQTPTAKLNGADLMLTEAPQLSQNAYYSQIVMDISGQSTISVEAYDLNSNRTTNNLSFGLSKVLAKGTIDIEVPGSSVNLSIPEGAVFTDSKVLLTTLSPSDLTLLAPLNPTYSINDSSITPVHIFTADFSSTLASPITLKTDPMTNSDATFYEITSQGWLPLDTYVDDDGQRWSFSDHEGAFALARGNDRAIYVPTDLKLKQNYPNPFNASTMFEFEIPSGHTWTESGSRQIQLDVYNILGQQIFTLVNQELTPGQYQVSWSGLDVQGKLISSGVYFARLRMGDKLITNKMLLLK
jgi:YVTN family beta-propeller protein